MAVWSLHKGLNLEAFFVVKKLNLYMCEFILVPELECVIGSTHMHIVLVLENESL